MTYKCNLKFDKNTSKVSAGKYTNIGHKQKTLPKVPNSIVHCLKIPLQNDCYIRLYTKQ